VILSRQLKRKAVSNPLATGCPPHGCAVSPGIVYQIERASGFEIRKGKTFGGGAALPLSYTLERTARFPGLVGRGFGWRSGQRMGIAAVTGVARHVIALAVGKFRVDVARH
jgi:hypothetical protein